MAMHVSMGQANHPHPRRMTGEEIIEEYLRDIGYVNNLASRSQHQLASTLPQSGESKLFTHHLFPTDLQQCLHLQQHSLHISDAD